MNENTENQISHDNDALNENITNDNAVPTQTNTASEEKQQTKEAQVDNKQSNYQNQYENRYVNNNQNGQQYYSQNSYQNFNQPNRNPYSSQEAPYQQQYNPYYAAPQYAQSRMYQNQYSANPYNDINKKPKSASRSFVVVMTALSVAVSFVIGFFTSAWVSSLIYAGEENGYLGDIPANNNVIIEYAPKDDNKPVITDKGNAAYVNSLVSSTVVEVSTETVTTDSFFGQYITEGAGSGVIVSSGEDGSYIITCAHVIDGASKITVKLNDKEGTTYEADSFLCDTESDIGVIKLNVKNLPCAKIGDFSKVVVGEEVVAIGNPLGTLGGSVTSGIVSALERDVIIDGTSYNLLQTNAEINPGNSGGGLFNTDGELIGVVNAKSVGENVEGLGFAIPVDDAMHIMSELLKNGYVSGRVKLGFSLIDVLTREDVQAYFKYSRYFTDYGVYIIESESSDFMEGDLLLAIDSIKVSSISDVKSLLQDFKVGQTVKITVSRLKNNKAQIFEYDLVLTEKTPVAN